MTELTPEYSPASQTQLRRHDMQKIVGASLCTRFADAGLRVVQRDEALPSVSLGLISEWLAKLVIARVGLS